MTNVATPLDDGGGRVTTLVPSGSVATTTDPARSSLTFAYKWSESLSEMFHAGPRHSGAAAGLPGKSGFEHSRSTGTGTGSTVYVAGPAALASKMPLGVYDAEYS